MLISNLIAFLVRNGDECSNLNHLCVAKSSIEQSLSIETYFIVQAYRLNNRAQRESRSRDSASVHFYYEAAEAMLR